MQVIRRSSFLLVAFIFIVGACARAVFADVQLLAVSPDSFSHPHDLTLDNTGRLLFVTDMRNDVIKVLNAQTLEILNQFGKGELSLPHDAAFRGADELLVADSGNNRIVAYQVDGNNAVFKKVLVDDVSSPEGVSVDDAGNIYFTITGAHRVARMDNTGQVKTVGEKGNGKREWKRPHDIEFAADGLLYVADPGNNRIKVLDTQLNTVAEVLGGRLAFKEPKYLSLDDKSILVVADQHNNMIRIFNNKREEITRIEHYTVNGRSVSFNKPEGAELINNKLWISDTYNNRIVLFVLPESK